MTDARENVLVVRMLGGFSVTWNGKLIAGGSKANGSQFAYLLQILIQKEILKILLLVLLWIL